MKYANLTRAGEIASMLPRLESARAMLSDMENAKIVVTQGESNVELPTDVTMNIVSVINMEINRLRKEVEEL